MSAAVMVHWAHVDAEGRMQRWGSALGADVFAQELLPGLTAVARPADISGFDKVRFVDGTWIKEEVNP